MDYNLKHEIQLKENSENSECYRWFLKEGSTDRVFIPLEHQSLYFTASELRYHHSFKINTSDSNSQESSMEMESTEHESISGALHPGDCIDGKTLENEATYSMFGTDRIIKDFKLYISKSENSNDKPKCFVRGFVVILRKENTMRKKQQMTQYGLSLL